MSSPILERLRAETARSHRRLEDAIEIQSRLRDPISYRQLLEAFFGFYAAIEPRLEAIPGWAASGFAPAERRKTPWLLMDLAAVGLSADEVSALPRCSRLPEMETPAQGFGCAYVLEGSTLGGRMISGLLTHTEIPSEARRFFHGYGDRTAEQWKHFCSALETFDAGRQSDEIARAAEATFTGMEIWLSRQLILS